MSTLVKGAECTVTSGCVIGNKVVSMTVIMGCTGGTGVTGLFEDNATGQEVAIKLISRPLPKPSMPNILREITVSPSAVFSSLSGSA